MLAVAAPTALSAAVVAVDPTVASRAGPGSDIPRRGLAQIGHAVAQEADHLLLLVEIGEQAAEGARQCPDLVVRRHRHRAGERSVAGALDEADEQTHRSGDARSDQIGREQAHEHHRHGNEHQAAAELHEGRHRLRAAAHGENGTHAWPDELSSGAWNPL